MSLSVAELAKLLGLSFEGEGERRIDKVSSWEAADAHSLVFLEGDRQLSPGRSACVIARPERIPSGLTAILSERPKLDFARAAAILGPRHRGTGIRHATASISPEASLAEDVNVGPNVTVEPGARIGAGCILHSGAVIGRDCLLGQDCTLYPRVVLYPGVRIGDRVIIHAGSVIGGDGFGYVFDGQNHVKFPQAGDVVIEDDVEIGCNVTIDRGSLGTTRIGRGTKLDNLIHIAHNVDIGMNVVIAAQTGISGSTVIEDGAIIGGQVGFGDHARVQSGAVIGSKAGILPGKIVRGGEVYWGIPVRPLREYKRLNALFGKLPEMKAEIETLRKRLGILEKALEEESDG